MAVKQKCVEMVFAVYGKFVYEKGLTKKDNLSIETLGGIKKLKLNVKECIVQTVRVDMGEPILAPASIPVVSNEEIVKNLEIKAFDTCFRFTCVSVGNPHAITYVEDIDEIEVEKYGPIIEVDGYFPNKTNVEFIEVLDRSHIKMRVWERGSGETLACGTGACASVVASILNHFTERKVEVELLGGNLEIEWSPEDNHIYMTGPATTVFEGELSEELFQNKEECKHD